MIMQNETRANTSPQRTSLLRQSPTCTPAPNVGTVVVGRLVVRTPYGQSGTLHGLMQVPSKRRCLVTPTM